MVCCSFCSASSNRSCSCLFFSSIYTHTHTHAHTHTHTHTRTHAHTHARTHTQTDTHTHTYKYTYAQTSIEETYQSTEALSNICQATQWVPFHTQSLSEHDFSSELLYFQASWQPSPSATDAQVPGALALAAQYAIIRHSWVGWAQGVAQGLEQGSLVYCVGLIKSLWLGKHIARFQTHPPSSSFTPSLPHPVLHPSIFPHHPWEAYHQTPATRPRGQDCWNSNK